MKIAIPVHVYAVLVTSVLWCIYMHRLEWSLIAKQSVCLVDPISMSLLQLRSQKRSHCPSSLCMFEAIGMKIMTSSNVVHPLPPNAENVHFAQAGASLFFFLKMSVTPRWEHRFVDPTHHFF